MSSAPHGYKAVLAVAELPDGERTLLEVDDRLVILFRIGEQFFCIDDVCTHDGGSLADGEHCGFEISCPRHGARFDIRTGAAMCMPATEPTKVHECTIYDGQVWIKVAGD